MEYGTQTLDAGPCRLLREDTLTAGEAMDLGGTWTSPGRRVRPIPWR
ncbi:MAG: hypothetical protein ACLUJG_08270 [Lawsonibacter sp.]